MDENRKQKAARCREILRSRPDAATPELCQEAVEAYPQLLSLVPDAMKTEALCLAAVEELPWVLEDVPDSLKTPDVCSAAVSQHGILLGAVPERLRTPDLCLDAIEDDWAALEFVPERFMDATMCASCIHAAADTGEVAAAWDMVPERLQEQTKDVLKEWGEEDLLPAESQGPRP